MKNPNSLLLILFFLIVNQTSSYCQWRSISSGTDQQLFCVHFPSDSVGYVIGRSGTVLKSTDKGNTWNPLTTELDGGLFQSVYFLNDSIGFITGATYGKILKTVNGGSSWATVMVPTTNDFYDIKFINDSIGLVVGYREIWKTTDQGETWSSQYANQSLNFPVFTSIEFLNADTIFIAGVDASTGRILKTTNGGMQWISTSISPDMRFDVKFTNELVGYTTGNISDIFKTTDGGVNWSALSDPKLLNIRKLYFFNEDKGYVAGANGNILSTEDGGLNWLNEETGTDDNLNWIYFVTETLGFAVGDSGTILKFSNEIITSVDESVSSDIKLFPNPSPDNVEVVIKTDGEEEVVQLSILNTMGGLVYNEQLCTYHGQVSKNLNVSNFPAGQYLLSIRCRNQKQIIKKFFVIK